MLAVIAAFVLGALGVVLYMRSVNASRPGGLADGDAGGAGPGPTPGDAAAHSARAPAGVSLLLPGTRVLLRGLRSRPELNGEAATVVGAAPPAADGEPRALVRPERDARRLCLQPRGAPEPALAVRVSSLERDAAQAGCFGGKLEEDFGMALNLLSDMALVAVGERDPVNALAPHEQNNVRALRNGSQADQLRLRVLMGKVWTYWNPEGGADGGVLRDVRGWMRENVAAWQKQARRGQALPRELVLARSALAPGGDAARWQADRLSGEWWVFPPRADGTGTPIVSVDPGGPVAVVLGWTSALGHLSRASPSRPARVRGTMLPWFGRLSYDGLFVGVLAGSGEEAAAAVARLAAAERDATLLWCLPPAEAARAHAAAACADTASCASCAALRASSALCALPTCSVQKGQDDVAGGARLQVCGACRGVAYCCEEHQKQHWPDHKDACKAAAATRKAAGAAASASAPRQAPADKRRAERIAAMPLQPTRDASEGGSMWVMKSLDDKDEAENPEHVNFIMSPEVFDRPLHVFRSARLAPDAREVAAAVAAAAAAERKRPGFLGVQAADDVVAGVRALLEGSGINVGRYAPPSAEELENMDFEAAARGLRF